MFCSLFFRKLVWYKFDIQNVCTKNLPRKDLGMTKLTEEMFQIFDQPEFSFKKIKATHTEEEVAAAKEQFKSVWQIWKQVNQTVAAKLPAGEFAKAHVES